MARKRAAVGIDDFERLRHDIEERMRARGLSSKELAQKSRVSPLTLDNLFDRENERESVRTDVILRLAQTLELSADECQSWLAWAGHKAYPLRKIAEFWDHQERAATLNPEPVAITKGSSASFTSPAKYFADLTKEIQDGSPALMCVCLTSKPAPISDPQLKASVLEVLKHGLHMILVCPYPPADYSKEPRLGAFYDQTSSWTLSLAGELRQMVGEKNKEQIQAFFPKADLSQGIRLVPPVLRSGEYRPCLVKLIHDGIPTFQLGAYGRSERHWMVVYPRQNATDQEQAESLETCGWWQDYFGDFLKAWQPEDASEPFPDELPNWNRWKG